MVLKELIYNAKWVLMMAKYRWGLEMNEIMCSDEWLRITTGGEKRKLKMQ